MACANRRSTPGLIDQARAEPHRFEFFQLVRLLRLHYSRTGRMDLETRPHEDPLRFRSQLSLNFPASEVSDLQFEHAHNVSAAGLPLTEVEVTFMGLVGPSGVLPRPYTELLMERHIQYRDDAAHAFLDIFSHRMTTLFYEAWQKYKFYIEYERHGTSGFDRYLLNLVGLGPQAQKQKFDKDASPLRRELFSYFSGMFAQKPRNTLNLQVMLSFYFSLPFKVKPFAGRWLHLGTDQRTRLGRKNAVLGQSAVAGNRVWDYQSCVRIELGPLELADYQRFLPGTVDYQKLVELVRFYVGAELDFQLAPRLKREAVPVARLGRQGNVSLGRLGWLKPPGVDVEPSRCALFHIPFDGVCL
ncbi:type VI secretion system protein [Pseudomonas agarici]|uniref:Type VI secretion system protein n=1 Tax=Pseudomonas agarici TaxID=46677 RepID=A0A0X1T731_PSEAA|nr:type VI secretion system baseplate subunit TssG [Pseudomonas agarici]AMB87732.1 type VI secretion system protein [Pseudomonas agarici]NWB91579.1 type VI secretion system baseplate subunit TssG [Pseudomonas agarici]NWC10929.1 type VI secretion system baseplate subunit TssG [Pseudomonas agarici]SEK90122.1 type VI secretion system protein ImpH [Pseudomonas agarici]